MTPKKIYIGVDPSIQQGKCGYCRVEDGVIKECKGWGIGYALQEILYLHSLPENKVTVYLEDANCRGPNYKLSWKENDRKKQGAGIVKGACAVSVLLFQAYNVNVINNFWKELVPYSKAHNVFPWRQMVGWPAEKKLPNEHARMAALLVSHHIKKPVLLVPKKAKTQ